LGTKLRVSVISVDLIKALIPIHHPDPTVPCCNLCVPSLLDKTRPGAPPVVKRQSAVKRGQPSQFTRKKLEEWRTVAWKRDFPKALFGSSAILKEETVEFLSSVGRISSRQHLTNILAGQWKWENQYGDKLYVLLSAADVPLMKPLPKKTRGTKRTVEGANIAPGVFEFQAIETPEGQIAPSSSNAESSLHGQKAREQKAINREQPNTRQQALITFPLHPLHISQTSTTAFSHPRPIMHRPGTHTHLT
jgi:hypothetical protein